MVRTIVETTNSRHTNRSQNSSSIPIEDRPAVVWRAVRRKTRSTEETNIRITAVFICILLLYGLCFPEFRVRTPEQPRRGNLVTATSVEKNDTTVSGRRRTDVWTDVRRLCFFFYRTYACARKRKALRSEINLAVTRSSRTRAAAAAPNVFLGPRPGGFSYARLSRLAVLVLSFAAIRAKFSRGANRVKRTAGRKDTSSSARVTCDDVTRTCAFTRTLLRTIGVERGNVAGSNGGKDDRRPRCGARGRENRGERSDAVVVVGVRTRVGRVGIYYDAYRFRRRRTTTGGRGTGLWITAPGTVGASFASGVTVWYIMVVW